MIIKRSMILLSTLVLLFTTGCAPKEPEHQQIVNHPPTKLDITLSTDPAPVRQGQEISLQAHIAQAGKPVNDAKVELEIWREGATEHETLEAKLDKEGTYSVKKSFPDKGLHHVTIHTTTSELHQMPTVDLQVQ